MPIGRRRHPTTPDDAETWLVVGLGNPGRRYQGTRHNVGFMAVERFARELPPGSSRSRLQAEILESRRGEQRICIAKPQTFMNSSGDSVRQLVRWYRVDLSHLLVVYDELDLPFGQLRLRAKGSDGGHNGVDSIIRQLGTQQFSRLRIGISRPQSGSTVPYVLSSFTPTERQQLPMILDQASQTIVDWITLGIDAAMNLHNRRADGPDEQRPSQ